MTLSARTTMSTPQRLASVQARIQDHIWGFPNLSCGCGITDGRETNCARYLRLHERASRIKDSLEPVHEEG